jgi:pimeloyl-ACP methyl ester carboxylesterase
VERHILPFPDGRRLSYQIGGEGTALLCIHAPGIGSVNFSRQLELTDSCRLILPDLRGHGDSSPAAKPFSLSDVAQELEALIRSLPIERVVLLGYSQGASIALEFCLQFPRLVAGFILVSGFSEVNELYLHTRFYLAQAMASLHGVSLLARSTAASHLDDKREQQRWISHAEKTDVYTLHQLYLGGHRYNCTARLGEIRVPSLLVYGGDDKRMHPYGRLLARHLPAAEEVVIPGVSHQVITKAAHLFNERSRLFLRSLARE